MSLECRKNGYFKRVFAGMESGNGTVLSGNDEQNNRLFEQYQELAKKERNVIFGGRLGSYKYYDMDKVIEAALNLCREELTRG